MVAAEASVDAPAEVVAGSAFEVEWSGPQNELDHLDFVTPGGEKMHRTVHVYQDGVVSPIKMTAPEKPGTYWVHYATHRGNELARDTFTVVAAEASVDAPAEVVAGSAFEVEWSGPRNSLDHLIVANEAGDRVSNPTHIYQPDSASPATLTAPEKPGTYQIYYRTHAGNILAGQTFSVK